MSTSEDEVFFGPVTVEEVNYLKKKKFVPSRRTGSFSTSLNSTAFFDNLLNEAIIQDETDAVSSDTEATVYEGGFAVGKNKEVEQTFSFQMSNHENVLSVYRLSEGTPNVLLKSPSEQKLTGECGSSENIFKLDTHSDNSEQQVTISVGGNGVVGSPLHKMPSRLDDLSTEVQVQTNGSTLDRELLGETFEDLRLQSLPPGGDFTLSPEKRISNQVGAGRQREILVEFRRLPDLLEENDLDNVNQYVPPTPCNSTLESATNTFDVIDSEEQCIPETPHNSVDDSGHCSFLAAKLVDLTTEKSVSSGNPDQTLDDTNLMVLKKGYAESSLFFNSPEKTSLQTESNDLRQGRNGILQLQGDPVPVSEDTHTVTTNAGDNTELDNINLGSGKSSDMKENVITFDVNDHLEDREPLKSPWVNKIVVPEMTDQQLDLLRQLWGSPQEEEENNTEASSGSPLMNALDLSTTTTASVPVQPAAPRTSLASLDLTVDERIPVITYMNEINRSSAERTKPLIQKVQKSNVPFRPRQTPMKVISSKVGIVNMPNEILASRKGKCSESKSQAKEKFQFTPIKATHQGSAIPVARQSHKIVQREEFKNPNSIHGFTTYKSKVSGKLFSTPTAVRKWNVKSPVAKYINEDPVQPLVKVVRTKDQKCLPSKSQTPDKPKVHALVSPSHERIPVAYYKSRPGRVLEDEPIGVPDKNPRMGRLFPSPYTPKVNRYEGTKKTIPGVKHLNPHLLNMSKPSDDSLADSSGAKLNVSTVKPVTLQRTHTLFKSLD